jgi:hypothetical protein
MSSVVKLHVSLQCQPVMSLELRCHLPSTVIFLQVIFAMCYSYMAKVICCLFCASIQSGDHDDKKSHCVPSLAFGPCTDFDTLLHNNRHLLPMCWMLTTRWWQIFSCQFLNDYWFVVDEENAFRQKWWLYSFYYLVYSSCRTGRELSLRWGICPPFLI